MFFSWYRIFTQFAQKLFQFSLLNSGKHIFGMFLFLNGFTILPTRRIIGNIAANSFPVGRITDNMIIKPGLPGKDGMRFIYSNEHRPLCHRIIREILMWNIGFLIPVTPPGSFGWGWNCEWETNGECRDAINRVSAFYYKWKVKNIKKNAVKSRPRGQEMNHR